MKQNIKTKVYVSLILLSVTLMCIGAGISADSQAVTVSWVVPADTTFGLAFAGAETEIVFDDDISGMNFTGVSPDSQTGATPMLTLTNNGNTAVDVKMAFAANFADDGIAFFNVSVDSNDNTTVKYWEGQAMGGGNNATNNQTVSSSLAIGSSAEYWIYSTGVEVEQSLVGEDTSTLHITTIDV